MRTKKKGGYATAAQAMHMSSPHYLQMVLEVGTEAHKHA